MSTSSTSLVREIYDAFGRKDTLRIFSLLVPEVEIVQSDELPWGGCYRGHEGVKQFLSKLTAHLRSTVVLERLVDAGDHVVAIGWTQGQVLANGAEFNVPLAHVWKVKAGLVTQVHFHIDHPTMLSALNRPGT